MAERVLMNEYKALLQESWTNIEVSSPLSLPSPARTQMPAGCT